MTSLALGLVFQASLLATGASNYKDAYTQTAETGKPLVILVGADWCPACRTMKNSVLPRVAEKGTLEKVSYVYLNSDQDRSLARKLMRGNSIPQLIMFRKNETGWVREQLDGAQGVDATHTFLRNGAERQVEKIGQKP